MTMYGFSDEEKKILSDNLNFYMKLNNVSRKKLSEDLSIPYTTLSEWINGNIYPAEKVRMVLEEYFGIEKGDLQKKKSDTEKKKIENDKWVSFVETTLSNSSYKFNEEQKKQIIRICEEVLNEEKNSY